MLGTNNFRSSYCTEIPSDMKALSLSTCAAAAALASILSSARGLPSKNHRHLRQQNHHGRVAPPAANKKVSTPAPAATIAHCNCPAATLAVDLEAKALLRQRYDYVGGRGVTSHRRYWPLPCFMRPPVWPTAVGNDGHVKNSSAVTTKCNGRTGRAGLIGAARHDG